MIVIRGLVIDTVAHSRLGHSEGSINTIQLSNTQSPLARHRCRASHMSIWKPRRTCVRGVGVSVPPPGLVSQLTFSGVDRWTEAAGAMTYVHANIGRARGLDKDGRQYQSQILKGHDLG